MLLLMFFNIIISLAVGIISRRLCLSFRNAASLCTYTFFILWMDLGIDGWIAGLIYYTCYRLLRYSWENDGM